mmetsp:Transcript_23953/g.51095  ORF Transcript_23953/g.51095 Transcript_23953/m.51095 type:complete len:105 (+) Transcript_23953:15-329(+)
MSRSLGWLQTPHLHSAACCADFSKSASAAVAAGPVDDPVVFLCCPAVVVACQRLFLSETAGDFREVRGCAVFREGDSRVPYCLLKGVPVHTRGSLWSDRCAARC